MADEMVDVLRELSGLLRRLTEQNDENARRADETRVSSKAMMEETRARMEEGRVRSESSRVRAEELRATMERKRQERPDFSEKMVQMREEDSKFKQRLLDEIQRHNQLLETLIVKMGR